MSLSRCRSKKRCHPEPYSAKDLASNFETRSFASRSEYVNVSRDTGLRPVLAVHAWAGGPCHGEVFTRTQDDT